MSGPVDSEDESVENIPRPREFGEIYGRMLDLAPDHVRSPMSAKIDCWEDATFRIKIFHSIGNSGRELLHFHSEEGVIKYGLIEDDMLVEERVLEEPS